MTVFIAGLGIYLPQRIVTNDTLSAFSGLDATWIKERTDISHRRLGHSSTAHMATVAASEALARAATEPQDIGFLAVVSSYHQRLPHLSTAETIKLKLGLSRAIALDICTPYTGFLTALQLAAAQVKEHGSPALIVGAEGFYKATKLKDRRTCYLFSDGAGALLLAQEGPFAHLGEVLQGQLVPPPGDTVWECMLPTRTGRKAVWRTFKHALEVTRARFGTTMIHVPSQWLVPDDGEGALPRFALHQPLGETADFLSASLPLVLYHFLRGGEFEAGEKVMLFASDAMTSWSVGVLDLLATSKACWETQGAPSIKQLSEPGEGPTIREYRPAEVTHSLAQLTELAVQRGAEVVCLVIHLDEKLSEKARQEATRLLASQIRSTDILFQAEDTCEWVVLLKYIDQTNATRLADRLQWLLEQLDPAGEMDVPAHIEVQEREQHMTPQAFAEQVTRLLRTK